MKLFIDQKELTEKKIGGTTFSEFCSELMSHLLAHDNSIACIKLDGTEMSNLEAAEDAFANASLCEVVTLPVKEALQSSVTLQKQRLSQLVEACNELVTDCLLDEPSKVAKDWTEICIAMKSEISLIPSWSHYIVEEEVIIRLESKLASLDSMMKKIHENLNKADVVGFSDILELETVPWLNDLADFFDKEVLQSIAPQA